MQVMQLGYVSRVMSAFVQQSCMLQAIASESLFLFPWLDCFRYISLLVSAPDCLELFFISFFLFFLASCILCILWVHVGACWPCILIVCVQFDCVHALFPSSLPLTIIWGSRMLPILVEYTYYMIITLHHTPQKVSADCREAHRRG